MNTPPELEALQSFVNTIDLESEVDAIGDAAGLKQWLVEHHLLETSDRVAASDVAGAHVLRESVRAVLEANDGHPVSDEAVATLNATLQRLPMHIRFNTATEPLVAPSDTGVDGALASLVAGIPAAVAAGTRQRLKVCASDTCRWAFYDHSKNQSGRWCSMKVCGNRSKTRKYRARSSG